MSYQLLIADDHPLFRDALMMALQQGDLSDSTIALASTLEETLAVLEQRDDLDLLMLDLRMPGSDGFFGLIQIRKTYPDVPVVVISGSDDPAVISRTRTFGALGFIAKSAPTDAIRQAVLSILNGDEVWPDGVDATPEDDELLDIVRRLGELTEQQRRVLQHLQQGRLNKQIAYDLNISEATVKAHVTAIFRKLGVLNRTQAVILVNRLAMDTENT